MESFGTLRGVLLACLLVVSGLAATAVGDQSVGPEECPETSFVPGVGPACRTEDGLLAVFDGEGGRLGTTHGPDAEPAAGSVPGVQDRTPEAPVCEEGDPPYFQLVYVHAQDTPGMTEETRSEIETEVGKANAHVKQASTEASLAFVVHCEAGVMDVPVVQLDVTNDEVTFSLIAETLVELGYDQDEVKYWVVYSGDPPGDFGGIGNLYADDDHQLSNWNNGRDPMFAVTFEEFLPDHEDWFASTMLHEASHTMGAVQDSSPNFYDNRGGWHCDDEEDVMCYGEETRLVCDDAVHYDCGKDDYFDPRPQEDSYLADHWNIAHPYNRFLEGCLHAEGEIGARTPYPFDFESILYSLPLASYEWVQVPSACAGAPFAFWGQIEGWTGWFFSPGGAALLQICWYDAPPSTGTGAGPIFLEQTSWDDVPTVREPIRCDTTTRDSPSALVLTATGEVPAGAQAALVTSIGAASFPDPVSYTVKVT